MSKTISIRLSSELIQRIDDRCNTDGCSRNDFVKNAINDALKSKNEPIPEVKVIRISDDDGKTWINCN